MAYTIKERPEDFIVEEVLELPLDDPGSYSYYKLVKTDIEQGKALEIIARHFRIDKKYINIAGTKDKKAITTQYLSVNKGPQRDFHTEELALTFVGKGKERLSLGMLVGNKFVITLRNVDSVPQKLDVVPNYFDDQRFGINGTNHLIGECLVRKKFKEAVDYVLKEKSRYSAKVEEFLEANPTDYVGALRLLPRYLLRMYVHAFQSFIFNEDLKILVGDLKGSNLDKELPLLGFETEDFDDLFKKYNLSSRDFIIRQFPELTETGGVRKAFIPVDQLTIEKLDETTYRISFFLQKGSYATNVVKEMFK